MTDQIRYDLLTQQALRGVVLPFVFRRYLDYAVFDALRALHRQIREILETQLADTVKARRILADGTSERVRPVGRPALRSQERLYEITGAGRPGADEADC